eukprot:61132_1
MTDIQIWIGGYNNIMNRNQWEWIAPYKYTIYTYGQLVMGDYPYICNENCTDQEGIDSVLNIAKYENIEICNEKQIAVCNAPYVNYVGEMCDFSQGNCWANTKFLYTNMSSITEDIELDVDEFSLSTAVWSNTFFIITRNHIYSAHIDIMKNPKWEHITYNDNNSSNITKSISSFQYKSSLYLYTFHSENNGESTFDLIDIQLEDMNISTYNV